METLLQTGQALSYICGIVVAVSALFIYRRNARLERAKWAVQLHDKFFAKDSQYRPIREILDSETSSRDIEELVGKESAEFTDYLNFFELVAILVESGQLQKSDVMDLFEYYLGCLQRHATVRQYIQDRTKSFQHLRKLLESHK